MLSVNDSPVFIKKPCGVTPRSLGRRGPIASTYDPVTASHADHDSNVGDNGSCAKESTGCVCKVGMDVDVDVDVDVDMDVDMDVDGIGMGIAHCSPSTAPAKHSRNRCTTSSYAEPPSADDGDAGCGGVSSSPPRYALNRFVMNQRCRPWQP